MARNKVRLNSRQVEAEMKSQAMRRELDSLADRIAAGVRSQNITVSDGALPVEVREGTTDRARAQVVLAHAAGLAVQAKYGALTRAAAQVGLEVTSR